MAFISPIINGTGFAFKEVQGGEEKRFDIVITYNKKIYIFELKKWNGEEYHKKGLLQLGGYLEQYGLEQGYLLIFDFRWKRKKYSRSLLLSKFIHSAFCKSSVILPSQCYLLSSAVINQIEKMR